ncbi:MAG: helix-turn-helix transcriptional regulator [Elusimicrobiota bacterium]
MSKKDKKFLTTTELGEILGISRVAVYKKIKKGEINAIKIGKNYAIPFDEVLGDKLSDKDKKELDKAVEKTVEEYGEVLKLLGKE